MAASEEEALSKISEAENAVRSAYDAVLKAEEAGANVAFLLNGLNEAGMLLWKAHMAYDMGDFDSAFNLANLSKTELDGFVSEASILAETGAQQSYMDFMLNVVGSLVGAVAVVCGGFVFWFFLKRKYEKPGGVA
ncbi:MAG: hypothetical protein OEY22_08675 [Candidatus Bathyarchaeota archaeon]|nr:hypothetical protein [Candidatus Bathyarchaeota archaeon]MDH5787471.1 hypothetical protein [Candidatus Bathyarchaeota archaeon]